MAQDSILCGLKCLHNFVIMALWGGVNVESSRIC